MKNNIILFAFLLIAQVANAQMATFDSAAAVNAVEMIERSTATINKLDDLKEYSKKSLDMLSKVSSVVTTSKQALNIIQYQNDIIENLGTCKNQISNMKSQKRKSSYLNVMADILDKTNSAMQSMNSIVKSSSGLKMNDYERLTFLNSIEKDLLEIRGATNSLKRLTR